jgi:UDP-glucose 4-epimerase
MKILVTGGAGFIGSHIVEKLLSEGHSVTVVDNETGQASDTFHWKKDALNYKINVTNFDALSQVFLDHDFDFVFHLAAKTKIVPAMKNPPPTLLENYSGLLNVLELSRLHNIRRVVFSSSSSVYGDQAIPYREDSAANCLNPYALSKLQGEALCNHYSSVFSLDTVCLRYFNVFGERMPEKGQYAPVIAIFLRQRRNGESLTIVGDGHQRRDFVYVEDVVDANVQAAFANDNFGGDVLNVGHGSMVSVLKLAELISDDFVYLPERSGDAKNTQADITKICSLLEWSPTTDAITWVKELLT